MPETWLSRDAYDRLKAELEHLKTHGRTSIAAVIETARSHGDIRENAEFDAAKDEQGKMEARIRQLQQLLRDAMVSDSAPSSEAGGGAAAPGLVVTLDIGGDEETYLLVGSREERSDIYDVLTTSSPLGAALLGKRPGETVRASAPSGSYEVLVTDVRAP